MVISFSILSLALISVLTILSANLFRESLELLASCVNDEIKFSKRELADISLFEILFARLSKLSLKVFDTPVRDCVIAFSIVLVKVVINVLFSLLDTFNVLLMVSFNEVTAILLLLLVAVITLLILSFKSLIPLIWAILSVLISPSRSF